MAKHEHKHWRKGRHAKLYKVYVPFVLDLFKPDAVIHPYKVVKGLPEGAIISLARYSPESDVVEFIVEHPSFDFIVDGESLPPGDITLQAVEPEDLPERGVGDE